MTLMNANKDNNSFVCIRDIRGNNNFFSSSLCVFAFFTPLREKFTINPPLPEQQAIADILTTAGREIELLKKELEQQKLVKKYLIQQLLTGKIRVKGVIE